MSGSPTPEKTTTGNKGTKAGETHALNPDPDCACVAILWRVCSLGPFRAWVEIILALRWLWPIGEGLCFLVK